jgi:hypothetical protein
VVGIDQHLQHYPLKTTVHTNKRFCPPVVLCLEFSTVLCLIFRHQNLLEDLVARQITLSLEKAEMVLSDNLLWLLPVLSIRDKFIPLVTLFALNKIQL